MTSLVGNMSRAQEVGPQSPQRVVSFPELVRLRFVWRKAVTAAADGDDPTDEASAYYAALADFERDHGRIVNAYCCSDIEAAVALTERRRRRRPLRRHPPPIRRFHRVSDFATRKEPAIARLLHQCDELAIRAVEVLGDRNQRICMQLVMSTAGHLLSLIDRPPPAESEVRQALASEHQDFAGVQRYYRRAANGEAQLVYFRGMVLGLALLGALYLAIVERLHIAGVNEANIVGCLTAGAVGALVSVIARINTGSFALDFDVSPRYTLFLGSLRPWIGSIFGLLIYFAITSGFLDLFKVPSSDPEARFYFLCIVAFLAGFSERWAQDTLTGGLAKRTGATSTGPPAAKSKSPARSEDPDADT